MEVQMICHLFKDRIGSIPVKKKGKIKGKRKK